MFAPAKDKQRFDESLTRGADFIASLASVRIPRVSFRKEDFWDTCGKEIKSGTNILKETSIIYAFTDSSGPIWDKNNINTFNTLFLLTGSIEIADQKHQRELTMTAGNAYYIFNSPGTKTRVSPGSSWINYAAPEHILRENFERLTRRLYFREFPINSFRSIHSPAAMDFYQALCNAYEDLANANSSVRGALADAYEHLLLTKLCVTVATLHNSDKGGATTRIMPRYLQHAEAFMRRNLDREIALHDLSAAAGCSPRALQRIFKDYRNASPMEVLCNYRLAAAYEAIASGVAKNVTDLSMHLRFSSTGRFSTLFKKAYGKSPSTMIRFPSASV